MSKTKKAKKTLSPETLRSWRFARAGLDGKLRGKSAGETLAETGWVRSVGGANPYLALRARAGLSRAAVDAAVARLEIHELPAARGCTYIVPSRDYAAALRGGQGHGEAADMANARKFCGVTEKEVDRLSTRVLSALAKGELDPQTIKEAVGDAVRSLGEEGKKRGLTTTLPLALGYLQSRGEIRRVPVEGRLDRQRYRYALWKPNPLAGRAVGDAEAALELARRFFRWSAPATVAQLAWWAGLGVKAAKAAASELGLVALEEGDERLISPEDRDSLLSHEPRKSPELAFVGCLDNLFHPLRDYASFLDAKEAPRVLALGKKAGGSLMDLTYHAIQEGGRLAGFWDWDGLKGELVLATFGKAPRGLAAEAKALETWIRDELGDLRQFSLDSPESRGERLAALRKLGA
ncbi:winged helix DNA-binding domain-containing protein [bacterium]|nr:winged helix DNA-binding domain-containing protein [bacterium]